MRRLLRTISATLTLLVSLPLHAVEVVIPSDISVHLSAYPDSHIIPDQPVIFTLTVVNHGPEPVDLLAVISSDFYDQIDPYFGIVDCQGVVLSVSDGKTFHFNYWWYTTDEGVLAVGESRTCHITLAMTNQMPAVWPFSFAIPPFIEDINPANNSATVILRRGDIEPLAIPMLSPLFLLILTIGFTTLAGHALRQRIGPLRP
jgi:hypothetical protein